MTRTVVTVVPTGTSTPPSPPAENPPPANPAPPAEGSPTPAKPVTPPVYTGAAAGIVNQQPVAGLMVAALGAFALL